MAINSKSSDYINELFLYFDVDPQDTSKKRWSFITTVLWLVFAVPLLAGVSFAYIFLLILIPRKVSDQSVSASKICVARSFATKSKLAFLKKESLVFFNEKPFQIVCENNIYNLPLSFRLKAMFKSVYYTFFDVYKLSCEVLKYLCLKHTVICLKFYLFRLAHKVSFSAYFEQIINLYKPSEIITGNKEDRFALVEHNLTRAKAIELTCYPHGLEYAVKLPRGVVGDNFYCYTLTSQTHYMKIYGNSEQAFLFNPEVVRNLLGRNRRKGAQEKKIVFFPESRGKDVNYAIVNLLLSKKLPVYFKLHPLDSAEQYVALGVCPDRIIKDFDEAICDNIVLARKSTVLLEALYSDSLSCALLFDEFDYQVFTQQFPSLWDSRIKKVKSIDELSYWLKDKDYKCKEV